MSSRPQFDAGDYSTVTWFSGSLGWYASVSSMAAKFRWANRASLDGFCDFLDEFQDDAPATLNTRRTKPFDMADLNLHRLSRVLEEPVGILRSMSRSLLVVDAALLPSLEAPSGVRPGTPLYICPECIKWGHHSVFHELDWLDYCIHHPSVPLIRVGGSLAGSSAKQRRYGVQWAEALMQLWLESGDRDPRWPAPLTADSPIDSQRALPIQIERELKAYSRPPAQRKWFIWGKSDRVVMPHILNGKGRIVKWRDVVAKEIGQESAFRMSLEMSQDAANLILDREWSWADRTERTNAQMLSDIAGEETPTWRSLAMRCCNLLRVGYEPSIAELAALLEGDLSGRLDLLGFTPAIALYAMGAPVSPRLITLDLLSHALQPHAYAARVYSCPTWPYPGIGRYCAGPQTSRVLEPLPAPRHAVCPEYSLQWEWSGEETSVSGFLARRIFIADPLRCFTQYLDALIEIKVRQLIAAAVMFEAQLRAGEFVGRDGAVVWEGFCKVYREIAPTVCTSLTGTGLEVQVWTSSNWNGALAKATLGGDQVVADGRSLLWAFLDDPQLDWSACRSIDHLSPPVA